MGILWISSRCETFLDAGYELQFLTNHGHLSTNSGQRIRIEDFSCCVVSTVMSTGGTIVASHEDVMGFNGKVNEIRAERLARTTNPLALVAQQQLVYHLQNHPTHYTQNSSTRSQAIVNYPQPIYDQEPKMVAKDDALSKEKEIDKLIALIYLSFKKIFKPTNNNLRTSSNTNRENQDNTSRINIGIGYDNQRAVNEYGHVARECQKPKRVKDTTYHKEKMLLYKQEEVGFQLNVEQADWRDDTDDEPKD
ncbi:hypothetical protein Tco_0128566 [Tanacetum coccineum]